MTKTLFPLTADEISADSRKSPEKERKSDQALAAEEARVEAELAQGAGRKRHAKAAGTVCYLVFR